MIISVIGSSNPATREHVELAEEVGRELARRDIMVVCGGLSGIMEAVCRGAKSEGGTTIGILPGRAAAEANSYQHGLFPKRYRGPHWRGGDRRRRGLWDAF